MMMIWSAERDEVMTANVDSIYADVSKGQMPSDEDRVYSMQTWGMRFRYVKRTSNKCWKKGKKKGGGSICNDERYPIYLLQAIN